MNGWEASKIKAYITGICGFAGSWLAEELLRQGFAVRGAALPDEADTNIRHLGKRVKVDRFNIANAGVCRRNIQHARPDYLFHLAAVSSVGQSFTMADLTFKINVTGTQNVYDAVRGKGWLKKLVFVSSSDVYGHVKKGDLPLKESQCPAPVSPYARSKAAAEFLTQSYIDQYELPAVIVRSFNHTGPRQNTNFVMSAFCHKIAAAERAKERKEVAVGNLDVRRDFSDVRDIVRGYRLLAQKGKPGQVYQLCCGKSYRIGDLLNKLIAFSDISIKVTRDKALFRKADIAELRGSFHRAKKELGWMPQISIDTTLRDTLEYARGHN